MYSRTAGHHKPKTEKTNKQQDAIKLQKRAGGQLRNYDKHGSLAEKQTVH